MYEEKRYLMSGRSGSCLTMEPFVSGAFQRLAMVRMCYADEFARTLPQIFAVEVSDPMLGDDVVDMGSGRNDAGSCF